MAKKYWIEVYNVDGMSPSNNGTEWVYESEIVPRIGDTLVFHHRSLPSWIDDGMGSLPVFKHRPSDVWTVQNVQWVFRNNEEIGSYLDTVLVWVKYECAAFGSLEPRVLADNAKSNQNRHG